jgi:SAM-dependent methyltransferase
MNNVPGSDEELNYWSGVFDRYAKEGSPYIEKLLSQDTQLQPQFANMIGSYADRGQGILRVLDVGCGPLTVLGKRAKWKMDIVGVDPLAGDYANLLASHDIHPPFTAMTGTGEELGKMFPAEHFDFVHSRNALDHCENASKVIQGMLAVAKTGTQIFFTVFQNEAENAAYSGFHRWNFDVFNNRIAIWNPDSIEFLDQVVGGRPYEYNLYEFRGGGRKFPNLIDIVIYKNEISPSKMTCVHDGVFASYSRKQGWITIVCPGELDTSKLMFLRGHSGNNLEVNMSIRWNNDLKVRSFALKKDHIDRIVIGQYYREFPPEGPKFVNVWRATVPNTILKLN